MNYPFNETFTTDPGSSFAVFGTPIAIAGSTAVYEPGSQSVLVTAPVGQDARWVPNLPLTNGFWFEADLELVSDPFGQKHLGIWLLSSASSRRGWRFSSYLPYNIDVRDFAAGTDTERPRIATPFSTTGTVTWRIESIQTATGMHLKVFIGGVPVHVPFATSNVYGWDSAYRPAIFAYGCSLRVHALRGDLLPAFVEPGATSGLINESRWVQNPLAYVPGALPALSAGLNYTWKNIYQGGSGSIQGTTTLENIPGARQVRLYDKRSGLLVAQTWSNPVGHYEFNNVDARKEYFVVAHDHLRVYNAVVQDMLAP